MDMAVQLSSFDVARFEEGSPVTISYFLSVDGGAEQNFSHPCAQI
jgi:hypothetical protein